MYFRSKMINSVLPGLIFTLSADNFFFMQLSYQSIHYINMGEIHIQSLVSPDIRPCWDDWYRVKITLDPALSREDHVK